jgi:hypothetical protein
MDRVFLTVIFLVLCTSGVHQSASHADSAATLRTIGRGVP